MGRLEIVTSRHGTALTAIVPQPHLEKLAATNTGKQQIAFEACIKVSRN